MDEKTPSEADFAEYFVGRQALYQRLKQSLADPADQTALVILGWRGSGKSAFLRRFDTVFDSNYVGMYVSLENMPLENEAAWLETLILATNVALDWQGFNIERLPALPDDDLRAWVDAVYLPEVAKLIRPHRRLAWLIDDAHLLIDAVEKGGIGEDIFAYLHVLLMGHPQVGMALALDMRYEGRLTRLSPLVDPLTVQRIPYLTPEESAELLRLALPESSDSIRGDLARAAGGSPFLLQRCIKRILLGDDSKQAVARVYQTSVGDFQALWRDLSRDERYILTAVSSLLYEDPLRDLSTDDISRWLAETDYVMDSVSIKAAVRGLEYREILSGGTSHIQIRAGLFQKWLLENARLDDSALTEIKTAAVPRSILLASVAILLILIVLLFSAQSGRSPDSVPSLPTATLSN